MARFKEKLRLLQILTEHPIVTFACKKIGLSTSTYYRWHKDDKNFRDLADHSLTIGRLGINDLSEALIIREINNGNLKAAIFWLNFNHSRYRPVRTTYVDPIVHRHQLEPGEICTSCGYREPPIERYKRHKGKWPDVKILSTELYKRFRASVNNKTTDEDIRQMIEDFVKVNSLGNKITFVDFSGGEEDLSSDDSTTLEDDTEES